MRYDVTESGPARDEALALRRAPVTPCSGLTEVDFCRRASEVILLTRVSFRRVTFLCDYGSIIEDTGT